jgi:hypothetical protein
MHGAKKNVVFLAFFPPFLCINIEVGGFFIPPPQLSEHHAVWLEDLYDFSNNFDVPIH